MQGGLRRPRKLGRGIRALCDITEDSIIVNSMKHPASQITHSCKGVTAELLTQLIWFWKVVFIVQIYQHFTGPFKNFNSLLKSSRSFALLKPLFLLSTALLDSSSPVQKCFVTLLKSFHPKHDVSQPGFRRDRHSVVTPQPTSLSGSRRSRKRR